MKWKQRTWAIWPTNTPAHRGVDFLRTLQPLRLKEEEKEIQMQEAWAVRRLTAMAPIQSRVGVTENPAVFLLAAWLLLPASTVSLQTPQGYQWMCPLWSTSVYCRSWATPGRGVLRA